MTQAQVAELEGRDLLMVSGPDAHTLLDRLITCDIDDVLKDGSGFGALLSPQGKILVDFLVAPIEGGFLLDLPAPLLADLTKRLMLYRLRAKAEIKDVSGDYAVFVVFGEGDGPGPEGLAIADPRHAGLGRRVYVPRDKAAGLTSTEAAAWQALRIRLGIPEGGTDFTYGDAFPHETAMDQITGVDFQKGCYVGQEVVSRMQHRGTARRRPVLVSSESDLPATGTAITADGKPAGTLGSVDGRHGLAILRLDRAAGATDIRAGDVPVSLALPDWARYVWPETTAAAED
ncbi:tRNA-modifying protein YgfZ [Hartmannibacter diazotrophicus]|uniref:tRNA-modifying protein YgfZ n=1 Tax=Hartmannibacter diazotrophicus TaxID=1482074 RepID=A0A2C9D340_9HYPH|nr:folate-binding protein YgfZ [Hartmannibacter diazotrophicus]SON54722.1 tRNA-modifying protein YgfZ [Hartmannibacter diazotrophicus]